MKQFTTLVSVHDLYQHLDDPNWVVLDCRFVIGKENDGFRRYNEDHIPGAVYVHLDHDMSSAVTNESGRHPLPDEKELARKLGEWGIDSESQIVVYDDLSGMFAGRMWWLARWLGHENIALLDGGYALWLAEDLPVTNDTSQPTPKKFKAKPRRDMWLSTDEVKQGLTKHTIALVDARSGERFRGEVEPLDSVAGHIPEAINRPLQMNLSADKRFRDRGELKEDFEKITHYASPTSVVHMCGSGVTACHNILAMEIAGLSGSKLYVGSWSEWIRDPKRPVSKG